MGSRELVVSSASWTARARSSQREIRSDRENLRWSPQHERREAQSQYQMIKGGAKVLPGRGVGARVIGREQERQHVNEAGHARPTPLHADRERETNREFAVCHQERDLGPVG